MLNFCPIRDTQVLSGFKARYTLYVGLIISLFVAIQSVIKQEVFS